MVIETQEYRNKGWISIGDFLGTGRLPRIRQYRKFNEARSFIQKLGLKNQHEWNQYCAGKSPEKGHKPNNIPGNPYRVYKNKGWKGLGDWLGTGRVANRNKDFKSFKEARKFARKLKLTSLRQYRELYSSNKLPIDMPSNPHNTYKNKGFINYADFLGYEPRQKKK